jgi:hypothetical protein
MVSRRVRLIIMIAAFLGVTTSLAGEVFPAQGDDIQDDLRIPDSDYVQIVVTKERSSLLGRIVKIGEKEVEFETDLGVVEIPIAEIKKIKEIPRSGIEEGEYWFPEPNPTRLLFAPTARNLRKGSGYFCDYYVLIPGVAYGITDFFSIGGGVSLFPGFGLSEQLFYFTPKLGLKAGGNLHLSVGTLVVGVPDGDENRLGGILYGVGTVGPTEGSLTVGLGYGFVDSDLADKPMILVGGSRRLSRKIAILSENWIMPEVDTPIVSLGLRFLEKSLSADMALINRLRDPILPGVPYVDFVCNF